MADHTRLQALIKPLLRGVLLKVHPDFYAHEPAAKRVNQASVQRLQDLLAPVLRRPAELRVHESPSKSRDLTAAPLQFSYRAQDGSLQPVSFAFTASGTHTGGARQLCAQRSLDLVRLCEALGVQTAPETVQEIAATAAALGAQKRKQNSSTAFQAAADLRAARAREARTKYAHAGAKGPDPIHAALMSHLRRSGGSDSILTQRDAKHAVLRLNRAKVFFADSVDPQEYPHAVARIEDELHDLEYRSWNTLPLMVVDCWESAFRGGMTRYPGFVVLPCEFDTNGKPD
ncbi:hypothetical protein LPJ59_001196 [Coemansia sp. RSA 2399]|nr:hypothetical protein LPJ59_001196 [Coemansia sp. RSA 2399]KAJ1896205.1 hypothetical protein LPJ81_004794 [Coemansia sp. IMI 209127]